jgi:hypothetical protein
MFFFVLLKIDFSVSGLAKSTTPFQTVRLFGSFQLRPLPRGKKLPLPGAPNTVSILLRWGGSEKFFELASKFFLPIQSATDYLI